MAFSLSRSLLMSRIRSRGNKKTELALVKLLRQAGVTGWRRHQALFGKPDFIFPKQRVAVFVDGCFWHGCRWHCTYAKALPKTARSLRRTASRPTRLDKLRMTAQTGKGFWLAKLSANKRRDRLVNRTLRRQGWTVIRIWEHELAARTRDAGRGMKTVERILEALRMSAVP
jgi:DNA mismatch endonuclease (patch repair protein)